MKPTFVVLALFIAIPALADTILPCAPATAAVYVAQGSCTEDPFVLKDFAWNGNFGTVHVTPGQVELVPSSSAPGQFGLNFQGAGGTDPFSVSGNQTIKALFAYTIDPRPPILSGATVTLSPTSAAAIRPGVFAGAATVPFANITAFICAGDTFADHCQNGVEPPITVVVDTRSDLQVNVDFSQPVNVVDFLLILDMEANGGSISIIGGGTSAQAIPEPGSAGLGISGLAGLLLLAYRRRSRS